MEYTKDQIYSKAHIKFFLSTTIEVITQIPQLSDALLSKLLPTILDGLKSTHFHEYFTAVLMILSQISTKASLSEELISKLFKIVTSKFSQTLSKELTFFIVQFCQTQDVDSISPQLLTQILKYSIDVLVDMQNNFDISRFTKTVIKSFLNNTNDDNIRPKFGEFLQIFKIADTLQISEVLVDLYLANPSLVKELKKFRSIYPRNIENVVQNRLESLRADPNPNEKLINLLVDLPWVKLKETVLNETGISLYLSLHDPDHKKRVLSTHKLIEQFDDSDPENVSFFTDSLVDRIGDDSKEVVSAALSTDFVTLIQPKILFRSLVKAYEKFSSNAKITKRITKILITIFLEANSNYSDRIGNFLLKKLLEYKDEKIVNSLYCSVLESNINYRLFNGASSIFENANSVDFQSLQSKLFGKITENLLEFKEQEILDLLENSEVKNAVLYFLSESLSRPHDKTLFVATTLLNNIKPFFEEANLYSINGKQISKPSKKQFFSLDSIESKFSFILKTSKQIFSSADFQPSHQSSFTNVIQELFSSLLSYPHLSQVNEVVESFLTKFFRKKNANLFSFFSYFWMNNSDDLKLLRIRSLNFANFTLDSPFMKSKLHHALPLLLVSLSSTEKAERASSLACILKIEQLIGGVKSFEQGFYPSIVEKEKFKVSSFAILLKFIVENKERILADHYQIQLLLQQFLESTEERSICVYLIQNAIATENLFARKVLLQYITRSNSTEILSASVESIFQPFFESPVPLNELSLDIMEIIIRQYTPAISPKINQQTLSHITNIILTEKQHLQRIQLDALEILLNTNFILKLTEKHQKSLFISILMYNGRCVKVKELCQNIVRDIAWPTEYFVEQLRMEEKDKSPISKKKKQVQKKETEVGEEEESDISSEMTKILNLIELLPHKTNFDNPILLIKPLFLILGKFVSQNSTPLDIAAFDYTIQILIQAITAISAILTAKFEIQIKEITDEDIEMTDGDKEPEKKEIKKDVDKVEREKLGAHFDIEKLLFCLQISKSPQTHGKALILLSKLATVFPERVARHIMPIFTFMGDVSVSQDDNYTFQVLHRVIQSIIPRLHDKSNAYVLPIIQIFVEPLYKIPVHRRLPLFTIFIKSLESKYSHFVFFMLLVTHTFGPSSLLSLRTSNIDNSVASFCSLLGLQFSPVLVIQIFYEIICLLEVLTGTNTQLEKSKLKDIGSVLANISPLYKIKDFYSLKIAIFELIKEYLLDSNYIKKAVVLPSKSRSLLQKQYMNLFEKIMVQIRQTLSFQTKESDKNKVEKCKQILTIIYPIITRLNELLKVKYFVKVIIQLIDHPDPQIRRKSLLMLNEKIESLDGSYETEQISLFVDLLSKLTVLINRRIEKNDAEDVIITKQTALYSAEILARHFGVYDPDSFLTALPSVINCLKEKETQIIPSAMICIATNCIHLGPRILSYLPSFFPLFINVLFNTLKGTSNSGDDENDPNTLLLLSGLSSLSIIVEHLHQFLNPYLRQLLLVILHPKLLTSQSKQIKTRTEQLSVLIAENIETRLIITPISSIYHTILRAQHNKKNNNISDENGETESNSNENDEEKIISELDYHSVIKLLEIFAIVCVEIPRAKISTYYATIFKFFLTLFDFRSNAYHLWWANGLEDEEVVQSITKNIILSFNNFVLKLNEQLFKPLFLKVLEWSKSPSKLSRSVFFYQLIDHLSIALKSIFVPYFAYMLDDMISVFKDSQSLIAKEDEEKNDQLIQSNENLMDQSIRFCLWSLQKCFLYNKEKFVTKERFDGLLQPIVELIEIRYYNSPKTYQLNIDAVVACLTQLAVTVDNPVRFYLIFYFIYSFIFY